MTKLKNHALGIAIVIEMLICSSPARSITINFDDPGLSNSSVITNFYAEVQFQGISNPFPIGSGPFPASPTLPTVIGGAAIWDPNSQTAPGESPPNFAVGLGQGQPGGDRAGILMTFANPVSKLTLTGLDFGNTIDDTEEMTLTGYDSSGNLIGQKYFVTQFANGAIRGTIEFPGMKYIAFNYTNTQFGFYGIDDLDFDTSPPSVSIDSADLVANSVDISLSGLGSSTPGPLNIQLIGEHNTFQASFNNGENAVEGNYSVMLDRPSIPEDTYTKIIATWKLSDGDVISQNYLISPVWHVLGLVRHSQYNTPAETACSGLSNSAWVFDSNCNFTSTTLNSKFATQTYINGTGRSIQHGMIKYSKLCSGKYPKGANTKNSFLLVDEITGSCNKPMTGNFQAAYPNPAKSKKTGDPNCDDTTVLVEELNSNKDVKEIQDYCPACKDGHHIDNYTDVEACSGGAVGDFGNFWTINIGAK